jgi:hypothetical protein
LSFRGWSINESESDAYATEDVAITKLVNSTITSKSWDEHANDPQLIKGADQAEADNAGKLFVCLGGNGGINGYIAVSSPGEGQNVLTIDCRSSANTIRGAARRGRAVPAIGLVCVIRVVHFSARHPLLW